jgi:hypothetical protein
MLEPISQELPEDIKASLEPISGLDIHYVAIRRALKSQSSRPAVEQKKARAEQAAKGAQTQTESHKETLTNLQSALELKIARKTALEIELRNLSAEIEADEKKIAEMSMMGELQFFLGLQIKQSKEGTFVHQAKYTKDIVRKFKMEDSKAMTMPMSTTTALDADEEGEHVDQNVGVLDRQSTTGSTRSR